MPNYDLGTARGEVVLDFDESGIDKANDKVTGFGTRFKKAAGIAVGALALIGAGVAAVILKGGLDRALNIQDANEKLKGLGHTTQDIQQIMTNALAAVKGTAFGLDEAATVAATAVASGIKPGKELTKYLKLTADAATIAGVSLGDMGAILNQAHTQGKVFTDTLNQLAQRGIPVFQYLQDDLHVTGSELTDLVKQGKISADELDKVLWQHLQGSALASGNTTRGALANVGAAFSRLGAAILSGPVAKAPALLQAIARAVDRFAAAVLPANTALNGFISDGMDRLTKAIDSIDFTKIFKQLGDFVRQVQDGFNNINSATSNNGLPGFFSSMGKIFAAFAPVAAAMGDSLARIAPAIANLVASGVGLLPPVFNLLAKAMQFVADHTEILSVILAGLILHIASQRTEMALAIPKGIAYAGMHLYMSQTTRASTAAMVANMNATRALNGEQAIGTLQMAVMGVKTNIAYLKMLLLTGATKAYGLALTVLNGIQKAAAVAAAAFSAALDANPISLIILAIAALVAGLVLFFTQTKVGQDIWNAFVGFLTTSVQSLMKVFQPTFDAIGGYVNDFVTGFQIGWGQVMDAIAPVVAYIQSTLLPIWQSVYSQLQAAAADFWKGVTDAFTTIQTVVGQVVSWFQANVLPVFNDVMGQIQTAVQQAIDAINAAWATIQPAVQPVIDWFVTNILPNLGGALQALGIAVGILAGILAVALLGPLLIVGAAIAAVVAVVYGLVQAFNFVVGVIGNVISFLSGVITTINSTIVTAVTAVISFLAGVVAQITGFVSGVVGAIMAFFAPLVNYFQANVVPVIQSAVNAIISIINFLVAAFSYGFQVIVAVAQASVGALITGVVGAFTFISNAISTTMNAISTVVTTVWNAISSFISGVLNTIASVVSTVWGTISARISAVMSTVSGVFHTVWNAISSFIGGIVKTIVNNAISFFTPIVARVSGVLNNVRGTFVNIWNGIVSFVGGAVKTLVSNAISFLSPIVSRAKAILDGLVGAFHTGVDRAMGVISGIQGKITGFFSGAAGWLVQAGINVLTGFLNGLRSMFDNVTSFFDGLTAAIPKHKGPPAKDLKLLEKSGVLIMTGLANGLESKREAVLKQLTGLTNDMAKTVSKGVKDKAGIFTSVGNTIKDNLVQGVSGTKAAMDEILSDIARRIGTAYDALAKQKAAANAKLKDLQGDKKGASKARKAVLDKEIADQRALIKELNAEPKSKSTVLKQLSYEQKALDVLATQRDATIAKLATAQDNLNSLINKQSSLRAAVIDAVTSMGDITKAVGQTITAADGSTKVADVSVADMISNLKDAVTETARFQQAFDRLKKEGLNNTALQQLVENFDQTGSADLATKVASTGQAQIDELNALQKQLDAAGVKLGDSTSNALYKAGINAAQGIVDGLKAKEKDLQDEMTRLANTMVTQLKKELGIKSPSTVMHKQIGLNTGLGVAGGIRASYAAIKKSVAGMIDIPSRMVAGANPALMYAGATPRIPGTGTSSSSSYDNSQRTLVYNAAPGTQQFTAEQSLFDALAETRRAGW